MYLHETDRAQNKNIISNFWVLKQEIPEISISNIYLLVSTVFHEEES
jgi:hypothetical protein